MTIHIKKPIMNGGQRAVGIADYRLKYEGSIARIEIDYITKKEGMKLYPHPFTIAKNNIVKYPTQYIQSTKLYIVPIADMKEEC